MNHFIVFFIVALFISAICYYFGLIMKSKPVDSIHEEAMNTILPEEFDWSNYKRGEYEIPNKTIVNNLYDFNSFTGECSAISNPKVSEECLIVYPYAKQDITDVDSHVHVGNVITFLLLESCNKKSQRQIAKELGIDNGHLNHILKGKSGISVKLGHKLDVYFNQSQNFFINVQSNYTAYTKNKS